MVWKCIYCVKSLLNALEGKQYLIPVGRRLDVGMGLETTYKNYNVCHTRTVH